MQQDQTMICVTTDSVPGRTVTRVIGFVWGASGAGRDSASPTVELMNLARQKAYDDMVAWARSQGANGIIGVGFDSFGYSHSGRTRHEYTLYGTAVVLG